MAPSLSFLGGLPTWAVFVTAGVLLCWVLLLARTTALGYDRMKVYVWVLTAFPIGALGAGVGAGAVRAALGQTDTLAAGFETTGMTVLGAVVAVGLYSLAYIRLVFRQSPWPLLDAVAFTYPLALAFGRVGCLMNGCCFGAPAPATAGPFTLHTGSLSLGSVGGAHYAAADPTLVIWNLPVILAACALATVAVTEWVWRRRDRWRLVPGTVFVVALLTDATLRFFAEHLRAEPALGWVPLNPWQTWVLAIGLAAGLGLVVLLRARHPAHAAPPSPAGAAA